MNSNSEKGSVVWSALSSVEIPATEASVYAGIASGIVCLALFLVIHAVWITPIWYVAVIGMFIAGGGGGIPVVRRNGLLAGVEAVVDKDRTAALIALALKASAFVILTGVSHVSRGFGTPSAEPLSRLTLAEARALLGAGEFPRGSMGPKIDAACSYVEGTGHAAVITDMAHLEAALAGGEGTWIVP